MYDRRGVQTGRRMLRLPFSLRLLEVFKINNTRVDDDNSSGFIVGLCLVLGFVFAFPDTGTWLTGGNYFNSFGLNPDLFISLHKILVTIAFCVIFSLALMYGCKAGPIANLVLIISIGFSVFSGARAALSTGELLEALSTGVRQWGVFGVVTWLFAANGQVSVWMRGFLLGAVVAALLRMIIAPVLFYSGLYQAQIFGVNTLAADSVFLFQCRVCFLAGIVLLFTVPIRRNMYISLLAVLLVVGGLMLMTGSYRRSDLAASLANSIVFVLLYGWLSGRYRVIALKGFVLGVITIVGGLVFAVSLFNSDEILERLRSFSTRDTSNSASVSNELYMDDWLVLRDVLVTTRGMGVGFGADYGTNLRLTNLALDGWKNLAVSEVYLHVRTYELIARMGVLGFFVQIVIFGVIPIYCLYKLRSTLVRSQHRLHLPNVKVPSRFWTLSGFVDRSVSAPSVGWHIVGFCAMCFAVITYEGFFLFGIPFYYWIKEVVFIGMALGFLIRASTSSGTSRVRTQE